MKPLPLALAALIVGVALARGRGSWRRLTAAGVAAGALAAYGFGAFEVGSLESVVRDIGPTLGGWTYVVVGALAFLETAALIGLVAPGELTVVIGGVAAAQGGVDVVGVFLVAWACATAGDCASYALGRRLGRPFLELHGHRFMISAAMLERVEAIFARHGGKAIVVGRFVGIVRALGPFMAGISRMPPARFLAFDTVGAGLWAGAFTALGYVAAANLDRALDIASKGKLGLVAALVLAAAALYVRHRRLARRAGAPDPRAPGGGGA